MVIVQGIGGTKGQPMLRMEGAEKPVVDRIFGRPPSSGSLISLKGPRPATTRLLTGILICANVQSHSTGAIPKGATESIGVARLPRPALALAARLKSASR